MKLNHNLILTTDLEVMSRFWTDAIGLTIGDRPPFSFKGLWFYSEGKPFIHVAIKKHINQDNGPINHVAIEGADYETLITSLKKHKYHYNEKDVPLSGERQVFIAGPDGLNVEMLFPLDVNDAKSHSS